jgi:hypothetical protein
MKSVTNLEPPFFGAASRPALSIARKVASGELTFSRTIPRAAPIAAPIAITIVARAKVRFRPTRLARSSAECAGRSWRRPTGFLSAALASFAAFFASRLSASGPGLSRAGLRSGFSATASGSSSSGGGSERLGGSSFFFLSGGSEGGLGLASAFGGSLGFGFASGGRSSSPLAAGPTSDDKDSTPVVRPGAGASDVSNSSRMKRAASESRASLLRLA